MVLSNCLSDNSMLPPVSDAVTGIVYKNEYCVACNRVENPIIAWQVHLGCSSRIYDLLGSAPTSQTITTILEDDPEIFQRECKPCQYRPPLNIQPPRACFPMISTCLNKTQLESRTGRVFSQHDYETLVDRCMNGVYDLYGTIVSGSVVIGPPPTPQYMTVSPIYRNLACAQCNAANTSGNVMCLSDRNIRMSVPLQCMPEIDMIMTTSMSHPAQETTKSRPTTRPTTSATPAATTTVPREESFESLSLPINAPTLTVSFFDGEVFGVNLTIFRLGIEHDAFELFSYTTGTGTSLDSIIRPLNFNIRIDDGPEELPIDSQTPGIPFSISLSNLGGGQVVIHVESVEVNVTLDCPQGQAPVGLECRDTLCPNGYVSTGGRCFFQFGRKLDGVLINNDTNVTMQFGNDSLGSGFFLDCPSELVLISDNDFTRLTNDTILVHGMEFEVLEYNDEGKPLICPRNATITENLIRSLFAYPPGYLELTYVGCSLSAIGCILILITYGFFKDLRTLPTKILMNLALAILAVNVLFLVGGPVSNYFPFIEVCTTIAICLHFFFLAQFIWMSLMTFEMVRKFYQSKRMALDTKKNRRKLFIIYTLLGWSLPLLVITSTMTVNFTTRGIILYGVEADGSQGSCWINHELSAIIAFVAPLVFAVVFNLIMFMVVTVYIIMAARNQNKLKRMSGDKIPFLRLNIAIFITTPLPWVFGFIAILIGTTWAWYPFIALSSCQGFIIFIAFILTKRTLRLYRGLLTCTCCKKQEKAVDKPVTGLVSGITTQTPTSQVS